MNDKVWLVTGSGSGLGRYVVQAALASGDRVVASARRPEELAELVAQHPERLRKVKHDVKNETEAQGPPLRSLPTLKQENWRSL